MLLKSLLGWNWENRSYMLARQESESLLIPLLPEISLEGRVLLPYDRNVERTARSLGRPVVFFGNAGGYSVTVEDGSVHFFSSQDWQYVLRGNGKVPIHMELGGLKLVALPNEHIKNMILISEVRKPSIFIDIQAGCPSWTMIKAA